MKIIKIPYSKIDFNAYNKCIENSKYGTVYAMSWFLDAVSPNWSILMADDYAFVMPLPIKKKYSIKYLTQPYFCQQLGLFSTQEIDKNIFSEFINNIPYKYYNLQLNIGNVFNQDKKELRPNLILNLNKPYTEISNSYKSNCKRNIKKAEKQNQKIIINNNLVEYLEFLIENTQLEILLAQKELVKKLLQNAQKNKALEIHVSIDLATNEIIAGVCFLKWENRYYYLFPISSSIGKQWQTMSLIIDNVIKENSEKDIVLDFEGSSIEGVARFYYSFGAETTYFPILYKKPFHR